MNAGTRMKTNHQRNKFVQISHQSNWNHQMIHQRKTPPHWCLKIIRILLVLLMVETIGKACPAQNYTNFWLKLICHLHKESIRMIEEKSSGKHCIAKTSCFIEIKKYQNLTWSFLKFVPRFVQTEDKIQMIFMTCLLVIYSNFQFCYHYHELKYHKYGTSVVNPKWSLFQHFYP